MTATPKDLSPVPEATCEHWRVRLNGVNLPITTVPPDAPTGGVYYTHCSAQGRLLVEVTAPEAISAFRLGPRRAHLEAAVRHDTLSFELELTHPRAVLVELNALPPLILLFDLPNPGLGSDTVDIAQFGVLPNRPDDQTEGFAQAFQALNGTMQTLRVPRGLYQVGCLHLKQLHGFSVYLEPGSLIRIATSPAGQNLRSHGLWLEDCQDIRIFGAGTLDHQAYRNFVLLGNRYDYGLEHASREDMEGVLQTPWFCQSPVFLTHSQHITLEGLTVCDGRIWNVTAHMCDDLTLRRVRVITPPASVPEWIDGFAIGGSRRVLLEDCFSYSNDDCIASAAYPATYNTRGTAGLTVRRFFGFNPRACGIRLGWDQHYRVRHDYGDLSFEDCDFVAWACGLLAHGRVYGKVRLHDRDFEVRGPKAHGLVFKDALIEALELERVGLGGPSRLGRVWQLQLHDVAVNGQPVPGIPDPGLVVQLV